MIFPKIVPRSYAEIENSGTRTPRQAPPSPLHLNNRKTQKCANMMKQHSMDTMLYLLFHAMLLIWSINSQKCSNRHLDPFSGVHHDLPGQILFWIAVSEGFWRLLEGRNGSKWAQNACWNIPLSFGKNCF